MVIIAIGRAISSRARQRSPARPCSARNHRCPFKLIRVANPLEAGHISRKLCVDVDIDNTRRVERLVERAADIAGDLAVELDDVVLFIYLDTEFNVLEVILDKECRLFFQRSEMVPVYRTFCSPTSSRATASSR